MGAKENRPFQLSFNGFVKVDFQDSRVTSDGGLLLVRESDERLRLGKLIDEHLTDSRQDTNKKFPLANLVRQSVTAASQATRISTMPFEYLPTRPFVWSAQGRTGIALGR